MTEQRHSALAIHPIAAEEGEGELLRRRQIVRRTHRWLVLVVLVLLALGAAAPCSCAWPTPARSKRAPASGAVRADRRPRTPTAGQTLALPGTLQGFVQSPISARAGGYLKRWTKDIGSRVEKGELLAEIETPEIDQQLSQAVAARNQPPRPAWSWPQHGRALGGAAQARRGFAAGPGRTPQRLRAGARQRGGADANVQRLKQPKASSAWWRRSPA
jgi:multidrug efflux pump subunit AcrA (membrane-fusion protein)